jgi:sulfofructose kinase
MTKVWCLGIATLDYVYAVPALPQTATKHRATGLEVSGGGIAANASVAIARLGGASALFTRLGDDVTGDLIRKGLREEGVDMGLSQPIPGLRSPVSAVMVDKAGERMLVSYSDPTVPPLVDWLPDVLPSDVRAVLCDTRWEEGALELFKAARAAGVPAVLDGDRKPHLPGTVAAATHVAFSEQGIVELTGIGDPVVALESLPVDGPWLAVTCGAKGVWVRDQGVTSHVPGFKVDVVDTLGAGDVWHGAFALSLAEGRSELSAVRVANATAALKCTRFGGRKGAPTRAEVEAFLGERA